ncbi:response regulator transcription factor [Thalassomonas sp. RHCl1]|uniref:response regulator transcription factor n=1 Tax=Thalassomonas sp. RHCl1 TaxID=2995320 RepID=UPI00248B7AC7|nr:response regulator transcription factor [Thalassomonas sp. RHCl1]
MKDKVLIVEDELDIAELIKVHLSELDLEAEICGHGDLALKMALNQDFQLVILDVMLPGTNGLDICRELRGAKPLQAIMMLTSRTSETDRVLGLELGADDYLSKPFSVRELQARVRSQLRRVHSLAQSQSQEQHQESAVTCIGDLMVDHRCHQVTYQNEAIELTSTEFDLLSFLGKHPDQVFSRAQLLDSVWGYHHSGYEHTVNSHINRLRNKLERDSANPQIIQTVWGVGYKLNSAGVSG